MSTGLLPLERRHADDMAFTPRPGGGWSMSGSSTAGKTPRRQAGADARRHRTPARSRRRLAHVAFRYRSWPVRPRSEARPVWGFLGDPGAAWVPLRTRHASKRPRCRNPLPHDAWCKQTK
jgi:hypothetical protein